ncbi:MAG: hypothetical protein ABI675_05610 [Chitinophagaceae bacterium]
MAYEDFISTIDDAITEKGYANLTKRLAALVDDEIDPKRKVAIRREVLTIIMGSGRYSTMLEPDGMLVYRSPNFHLNESIIRANKSVQDTNISVQRMNDDVLLKNFEDQRKIGNFNT